MAWMDWIDMSTFNIILDANADRVHGVDRYSEYVQSFLNYGHILAGTVSVLIAPAQCDGQAQAR